MRRFTSWLVKHRPYPFYGHLFLHANMNFYRAYPGYQASPQWPPSQSRHSTYQTTPFAHSVIQHTAPSSSYPTPPPPGISASSSSLAGALGPPPFRPPRQVQHPRDSQTFFNHFLEQTPVQQPQRVVTQPSQLPPPPPPPPPPQPTPLADLPLVDLGSPDPLATSRASPDYPLTPRKRKVEQYLESPSVKRVQVANVNRPASSPTHTHHSSPRPIQKQAPRKPSVEVFVQTPPKPRKPYTPVPPPSNRSTPSSSGARQSSAPYVAVPPRPKVYHTPVSQKKERPEVVITTTTLKTNGKAKMKPGDEDDDLGGFGSEEGGAPFRFKRPTGSSPVKGSARKATGDRDERGGYISNAYVCGNTN